VATECSMSRVNVGPAGPESTERRRSMFIPTTIPTTATGPRSTTARSTDETARWSP